MHAAQESRSAIQHELISLQSESASKSNQIEKLKVEMLGTNKTLEDEREKALHEKEDMKRQLEEFLDFYKRQKTSILDKFLHKDNIGTYLSTPKFR